MADELMALFVSSATDRLGRMSIAVGQLRSAPDSEEVLRRIRRDLHTLKGESTVLELPQITRVVHAAEDYLRKESSTSVPHDSLETSLDEVLDVLLTAVARASEGKTVDEARVQAVIAKLAAPVSEPTILTSHAAAAPASLVPDAAAPQRTTATAQGLAQAESGAPLENVPRSEGPTGQGSGEAPDQRPTVSGRRAGAGEPDPSGDTGTPATSEGDASIAIVRVRAEVLDEMTELINQIAGGLVRSAEYFRALRDVQQTASDTRTARALGSLLREMQENAFWMDRSCSGLSGQIRNVRLRSLDTILAQYPLFVRRAARESGKEIVVQTEGCDVRLDQQVLEQISEPMLHLVRNAVVHGIESVSDRRRLGKPDQGLISVTAREDSGFIRIELRDDGGGIDRERVVRRALSLGIIDERSAHGLSMAEEMALIFSPNLSTLTEAGNLAGRGVGLDVVKSVIDRAGGHVQVESQPGVGTRFILHVPVSRSLSRFLLVEVDGQLFAFPNVSVVSAAWLPVQEIKYVEQTETMEFRGRLISLVRLRAVLGLGGFKDLLTNKLGVVVVSSGQDMAAFVVDRYIGERELVVRSLGAFLGSPELLGGVSVLENSDVVLVLHPPSLLRAVGEAGTIEPHLPTEPPALANQSTRRGVGSSLTPASNSSASSSSKPPPNTTPAPNPGKRVLYAEDSLSTRKYSADIMRSRGYEVVEASDGREALELLERQTFDVVLTDLQMPHVDGFRVIRTIRADPRHQSLPVIVLSTLATDETKRLALDAGADAYLVKSAFAVDTLMAALREVLG